jgi:hypothetical protein
VGGSGLADARNDRINLAARRGSYGGSTSVKRYVFELHIGDVA